MFDAEKGIGLTKCAAAAVVLIPAWALAPAASSACEMCWGAAVENPITQGIGMAMLLLVGMVGMVGGGIGAFFYHVQRRSHLLERSDVVVTEYGDVRRMEDPAS